MEFLSSPELASQATALGQVLLMDLVRLLDDVDQRFILQRGQWQPRVPGQPVRRRQHRHQVFFLQHLVADPVQAGRG